MFQEKVATLEKELSLERQTQTIQLSQYEHKLKEARERNSEQVAKIQRHLDDMSSTKNDLDKQLNALRHEHSRQQALFRDLGKTTRLTAFSHKNDLLFSVRGMYFYQTLTKYVIGYKVQYYLFLIAN